MMVSKCSIASRAFRWFYGVTTARKLLFSRKKLCDFLPDLRDPVTDFFAYVSPATCQVYTIVECFSVFGKELCTWALITCSASHVVRNLDGFGGWFLRMFLWTSILSLHRRLLIQLGVPDDHHLGENPHFWQNDHRRKQSPLFERNLLSGTLFHSAEFVNDSLCSRLSVFGISGSKSTSGPRTSDLRGFSQCLPFSIRPIDAVHRALTYMTPVPMVVRLRAQNQRSGIANKRSARWTVHARFSQAQKVIRLQNGSNRRRTDQTSSSIEGSGPSISSQGKEDVRSIHLLSIRSRRRRLPPNAFCRKFTEDRLRYPSIGSLDDTTISLCLNKPRHIEGSKRRDIR